MPEPHSAYTCPDVQTRSNLTTMSKSYLFNAQYVEKHLVFEDIQKHTGPNTALCIRCTMPKKYQTHAWYSTALNWTIKCKQGKL